MKDIIKFIGIFLLAGFVLVSCASEEDAPAAEEESYLVLPEVNDQVWTYFSLSTGAVVGTSVFGSAKGDEEWKNRTDWDMAICGEYIRTNSGTSGNGQGGLIKVDGVSYESITTSVAGTFDTDVLRK